MKKDYLSKKVFHVVSAIGLVLLIIFFRVWHLSILQRDKYLLEAQKPQTRTILLHANRGEIYDRFGKPLAINRICYNASIYYSHIKQIPSIRRQKDMAGSRLCYYPRKDYIQKLSQLLAKELDLQADLIEDLIHSKASLLPHVPYVIKKNISEKQYYRLKLFEREYTGLHAEITTQRYYPYGKSACNILGYMGKISPKEYLSIACKIEHLQKILDHEEEEYYLIEGYNSRQEVINELFFLKEKAYTYNDLTGKAGLEKVYEQTLRGNHGKSQFLVNNKGVFLQKLSSSFPPAAGKSIQSTISIELQQFAEKLLSQDEKEREGKSIKFDQETKSAVKQKQPYLKGGAIIAIDPNNGEIVALASYPRFDPNDFIFSTATKKEKQIHIHQWLETPNLIANLWDNILPLEKEYYKAKETSYYTEKQWLSWDLYIQTILPHDSSLWNSINRLQTVKNAIQLQEDFETLLFVSKCTDPKTVIDCLFPYHATCMPSSVQHKEIMQNLQKESSSLSSLKGRLAYYLGNIKDNRDKLLLVDLCRVFVYSPSFSDDLIEKTKSLKLSQYWKISKAAIKLERFTKELLFPIFHNTYFHSWKECYQKSYIQKKRKEEKEKKQYARPYIEYLEQKEKALFAEFWKMHKHKFLLTYLKNNISKDLSGDLQVYFDAIQETISSKNIPNEIAFSITFLRQELLSFENITLIELMRTFRNFSDLDRPLYGYYRNVRKQHFLQLEKDLAAAFYPLYGFSYGRSYAYSQAAPLGSIFKLVTAYAALSEKYESSPYSSLNPFYMIDHYGWDSKASKRGGPIVGYQTNGNPYPRFYKGGRLPKSSHLGIGKINLVSAIEQSSNPYFSILAKDYLSSPKKLILAAKEFHLGKSFSFDLPQLYKGTLPDDIDYNTTGLYSFAIGQHTLTATPLHAAQILCAIAAKGTLYTPSIVQKNQPSVLNEIAMPDAIRRILIEGMHNVIYGEKGNARSSIIKKLHLHPEYMDDYKHLENQFVGKTSTAEIMDKTDILPSSKAEKYKHIWFGGISFAPSKKKWDSPELVVVVYLRYADGGKEAAPLAAQIVTKYRKIKNGL